MVVFENPNTNAENSKGLLPWDGGRKKEKKTKVKEERRITGEGEKSDSFFF